MDRAPEPSNAEQSTWPSATCEYVASLHCQIEELIELALQYRNDLKFGVDGDSKIRRLEAIERALKP
jgi:phosphatidate phosphatase PAH1